MLSLTNKHFVYLFRLLQMIALIHCAPDTAPVWPDNVTARPAGRARIAERLISRYTNACLVVPSMAPMTWRRDNAFASATGRDRIVRKVSCSSSFQFSVTCFITFSKHLWKVLLYSPPTQPPASHNQLPPPAHTSYK